MAAVGRLPNLPMTVSRSRPSLASGLKAVLRIALIRDIVGLNLLSSLFNAGAYIIAIPYIVKEVYLGDAQTLAHRHDRLHCRQHRIQCPVAAVHCR